MGRRRYIENATGKAAQKRVLEQLTDTLVRSGMIRMQLMYPPPLNFRQLMRVLYEPDEIAAMHLLVKRNLVDVMETERQLTVHMDMVDDLDAAGRFTVNIPYPGALPAARTRVSAGKTYSGMHLDEIRSTPAVESMRKWMNDLWCEREIIRHLKSRLREIRDSCNTIGQALRVWPDVHHLLLLVEAYRDYKREAEDAKARSPIPAFFFAEDGDGIHVLKPEWQPAELEKWGSYLASLHMLPELPAGAVEFRVDM